MTAKFILHEYGVVLFPKEDRRKITLIRFILVRNGNEHWMTTLIVGVWEKLKCETERWHEKSERDFISVGFVGALFGKFGKC